MKHREEEHVREILHEAFLAGWQAGLGVYVRNPRVLAIIDSCFEQWLVEAADEEEVLGLMFRGRYDLPGSLLKKSSAQTSPLPTQPAQAPPAPISPVSTSRQAAPLTVDLTHSKSPQPVEQPVGQPEPRVNGHGADVDVRRRESA